MDVEFGLPVVTHPRIPVSSERNSKLSVFVA